MTGLEHETPPPPHLKRRVVTTLQERGLLGGGQTWPRLMRSAAAIVLFISGFALSRIMAQAEAPHGPRWLLLLYEDSTFAPRAPIPELVREYSAWADSLRRHGELVAGEKLGGKSTVVSELYEDRPNIPGDLGDVAGLFIVAASDEERAMAIVRSCPHLRHGGSVVLRPIE